MGSVAAWAHLRGCGHYGADSVESLQAFVTRERWQAAAVRIAALSAERVREAWRRFAKDFDRGAVAVTG